MSSTDSQDMAAQISLSPRSPEESEMSPSDEKEIALAAVMSLMTAIIVLGTIGNVLVILAVIHNKKLQTVSNMFVVNLSTCDFLFVTMVLPVNMYTYVGQGWQLPAASCKFVGFMCYTLTGTTVMTITLIAWNRYQLVVHVSRYKRMFRPRNMVIMLATSWAVPVLCLQPAVFETWGHFGYIPTLSSCNLDLDNSSQSFKTFLLLVRAAIPCALIVYCYNAIYSTTRASHQRLYHITCSTNSIIRQHNHRREMRLTRMMIAIFVVFVLSYFPCTISSVIDWSRVLSRTIHMFCQTSVFLGSAVNPLLYGLMNDQFRNAYYQILTCNVLCGRGHHTETITNETTYNENEDKMNDKSETAAFNPYDVSLKDKTTLYLITEGDASTLPSTSPGLGKRVKEEFHNTDTSRATKASANYVLAQSDSDRKWRASDDALALCRLASCQDVYIFDNSCI